jgi:hypothetical protein
MVPGYANPQSLNRYSYVNNNPLKYTDPSGHMLDNGCSMGCSNTPPPPITTPTKTPTPTPTATGISCPVVLLACNPTATSTPIPTSTPTATTTPTPYTGPQYTTPTPYYHYSVHVNWATVDIPQAVIDGLGIGGDIALIALPEGPGEIGEGAITLVELAAAGKAVYDAAGGDIRNLDQEALTYSLEHNPLLVARAGRWIPIVGSVGSGFSLYDNFKDAITISRTTQYR